MNTDSNLAVGYLPPGRYTVIDTMLWCEPAYVNAALVIVGYGPPVAIMNFPMNSCNILNQTTVHYGNMANTDEVVFQQRSII